MKDEIIKVVKYYKVPTCDAAAYVNRLLKEHKNLTDVVGRNRKVLIDLGLVTEYIYSDRGGYHIYHIRLTYKGEKYCKENNI